MTNQGGSTGCSGEWTICGGSSQSYADASVSVTVLLLSHYDRDYVHRPFVLFSFWTVLRSAAREACALFHGQQIASVPCVHVYLFPARRAPGTIEHEM